MEIIDLKFKQHDYDAIINIAKNIKKAATSFLSREGFLYKGNAYSLKDFDFEVIRNAKDKDEWEVESVWAKRGIAFDKDLIFNLVGGKQVTIEEIANKLNFVSSTNNSLNDVSPAYVRFLDAVCEALHLTEEEITPTNEHKVINTAWGVAMRNKGINVANIINDVSGYWCQAAATKTAVNESKNNSVRTINEGHSLEYLNIVTAQLDELIQQSKFVTIDDIDNQITAALVAAGFPESDTNCIVISPLNAETCEGCNLNIDIYENPGDYDNNKPQTYEIDIKSKYSSEKYRINDYDIFS